MAKSDGPEWFARLGIDRTCRLVGMHGGCVTLTRTEDGEHTLWLYDHRIATGPAAAMRNRFADHMRGHWLEFIYRT